MKIHPLRLVALLLAVSAVCGLVLVSVQQNYRQSANDPQIQMAEDAAAALQSGASVSSVVPAGKTDIARSLAPFISVYDDTGHDVASSAVLGGAMPQIPTGVLESARTKGENRVTWEPQPGVRQAIVVVHYEGTHPGFVVAGRSLREVEKRESALTVMLGVGWIIVLGASLGLAF